MDQGLRGLCGFEKGSSAVAGYGVGSFGLSRFHSRSSLADCNMCVTTWPVAGRMFHGSTASSRTTCRASAPRVMVSVSFSEVDQA